MVSGASASIVTADPEHYEGKNTACNKSCIARMGSNPTLFW